MSYSRAFIFYNFYGEISILAVSASFQKMVILVQKPQLLCGQTRFSPLSPKLPMKLVCFPKRTLMSDLENAIDIVPLISHHGAIAIQILKLHIFGHFLVDY